MEIIYTYLNDINFVANILAIELIAAASVYVLLDGFNLGVGMTTGLIKDQSTRTKSINTLLPYWDGSETWLILLFGGFLVCFPKSFAFILQVGYIPITIMLFSLIVRGLCFEFRFKASEKSIKKWDMAFCISSLIISFVQGSIVGLVLNGFEVNESGQLMTGPLSYFSILPFITGLLFIALYMNIGNAWMSYRAPREWNKDLYININIEKISSILYFIMIAIFMIYLYKYTNIINYAIENNRLFYGFSLFLISGLFSIILFYIIKNNRFYNLSFLRYLSSALVVLPFFLGIATIMWPMILFPNYSIYDISHDLNIAQTCLAIITAFVPLNLIYHALLFKLKI